MLPSTGGPPGRRPSTMLRATAVRALLASAVLPGSAYVTVTRPAQLGLDLRGGTRVGYSAGYEPRTDAP